MGNELAARGTIVGVCSTVTAKLLDKGWIEELPGGGVYTPTTRGRVGMERILGVVPDEEHPEQATEEGHV